MTTREFPDFEWHAVDDDIVVHGEDGRVHTGTRVATVTIGSGEARSTRCEIIAGEGEDFVVLETSAAEDGAARTRYWGLPRWLEYPDALLAACRSADEVRAWLGVQLVRPNEGGAWWRHFEALEEALEEERRREEEEARDAEAWDEMGMPDAGESGAKPVGSFRRIPIADLPEATLETIHGLLAALARKLPLDLTESEVVTASAREFDVYDRGVDIYGGVEWRVVVRVAWARRPALVVATSRTDDASDPDPEGLELALIAPAPHGGAESVATWEEPGGVELRRPE